MLNDATTLLRTNWGGNVTYSASKIWTPGSAEEIAAIVRKATKVRSLGSRHSFNDIANTTGGLISTRQLNRVIRLDEKPQTVTVEAGITYGSLGSYLHERGYAVENLPSLPHVCVGGAVQTGTHGSGTQNLSTQVVAMQLVTGYGDVVELSREREGPRFDGMVLSLGLLGVVTQLTLSVRPSFTVIQEVFDAVPQADILENYDAIADSVYSLSLFSNWQTGNVNQVWCKRVVTTATLQALPFDFLVSRRATGKRHPIDGVPAETCTEQGRPGPSHERLPHFRPDFEPSSAGNELQSEYFIPRDRVGDALQILTIIGPRLQDQLMISEVRLVKADSLWLSPAYGKDVVGLHFTWQPRPAAVLALLKTVVEPALSSISPRPHWGKVFCLPAASVCDQYPQLPTFEELCNEFDPQAKFRNDFARRLLFT